MSDSFAEALAHQQAGRLEEAVTGYRRVLAATPAHDGARLGLALALLALRREAEAAATLAERALSPPLAAQSDVYFHVGMAFQQRGAFAEAAHWFQRAGEVRPDVAAAAYNLGLALQNQGQLEPAIGAYREALRREPTMPEPRHNLVLLQQILGRHGEAIATYREGVGAAPENPDFPRYLVGAMFYDPGVANAHRFDEAERYGRRLRYPASRPWTPFANRRDPERRLRIGYLTSDFRDHPIARNMELLLASRDRARFEVIAYADVGQPDAMTERMKGLVDAWRPIDRMDDETVAALIRDDAIDILVCLAGHFDRNRPTVAACRPAPVQVSFHDVTTSGSDGTFDYLVADRVVAPRPGHETFTERVLRLPGIYVHGTPEVAPDPGPPPCLANGYVTFGSLNNPAKLNGSVLAVWGQILRAAPNSRLALKYRNWFHAADVKARIIAALGLFDISPDRLVFLGGEDSLADHLACYRGIDIALDPFPFTGSTATFEALWMGVPVVTVAGPTMMARWSASILKTLALDDLAAGSFEAYVAVAQRLASDREGLTSLRAGLREKVRASALCAGPLRARQIERLYRAMWRRWCARPDAPGEADNLISAGQAHQRAGRARAAAALYREALSIDPRNASAFHLLGTMDLQDGRDDPAEDRIRHALALGLKDPAAYVNHGHALLRLNRLVEAEAAFRAALALDPFRVGGFIGLADALRRQSRQDEALSAARKAAAIGPGSFEANDLLGTILQELGQAAEAVQWLTKAAALRPDARAHYNLGGALQAAGRTEESIGAYRQALALDAGLAEAHNNLGLVLLDGGDPAGALTHLEAAARLRPQHATVQNNLGTVLRKLGRLDEALACFDRAVAIEPNFAEAYVNAGGVLRAAMRYRDAIAALTRGLAMKSDIAEGFINLGLTLRDVGRLDEARQTLQRGVDHVPHLAQAHIALAMVLNDLGLHAQAHEAARRARELDPQSAEVQRNYLAVLLYSPGFDAHARFLEHRRFGRLAASSVEAAAGRSRNRDPERRLRIGYVSSDLCRHPVGRNMAPVFAHHDRKAFEIFAYAILNRADEASDRFRESSDGWRPVAGLADHELAQLVRRDGIDILVHLAGRFDRNRPGLAAWRAAPVQISWHDPATSGVPGMDYLIADARLVPPDARERFSERIVRLPSFYVHAPLAEAPEVGPLPAMTSGVPTFGIFNNPAKLSDDCLDVWAAVLRRIPRSRVLFKFRNRYLAAPLRARVTERLATGEIAVDRIEFIPDDLPDQSPLAIYNRVDAALDPFPFTGSTTTFESLWMGVPVVTLAGDTMVGRWSASMLRAAGLPELVAQGPRDYVDIAARLCGDMERLAGLRRALRPRVAASPLCDGVRRTRQVERVYRALWRGWCRAAGTGVS